jgi:hypothetical protein
VSEHRPERDDPRAARDHQERAADARVPRERPADRAAHLELVARAQLVDEVRRDLSVGQALDGELEVLVVRRRGDRVAPLGLVAVLGGQAHVGVLARAMARPVRAAEDDRADARGLGPGPQDLREPPGQSPW